MIKADNPDMTDERIAFGIARMKEAGIADSGDALTAGIGVIPDAKVKEFFDKMEDAGAVGPKVDCTAAFTTAFVGKGVGMDLKP